MQCESGPRSVIMAEEENTAEGQKHVIREAWRLFIRPFVFLLQDPNGPAPLAARRSLVSVCLARCRGGNLCV